MEEWFKVYKVEYNDEAGLIYKPVPVYDVCEKKGVISFLVFEDLEWKYVAAQRYIPAAHMHRLSNL